MPPPTVWRPEARNLSAGQDDGRGGGLTVGGIHRLFVGGIGGAQQLVALFRYDDDDDDDDDDDGDDDDGDEDDDDNDEPPYFC